MTDTEDVRQEADLRQTDTADNFRDATEKVITDDREKDEGSDRESDPETFPREYVEKLRKENGKYRKRAQHADELAHRLHRALVRSDGRLHDPTDLDFSDDHLADDGDALTAAIDDLLARKPHLAARRVSGDVGQGAAKGKGDVSLLGLLGGH